VLIGHQSVKEDLTRLVAKGALSHAYIFFGPEGAGKCTLALEFARFLENGVWPEEEDARPLTDATVVAPEGSGTIGIDAARSVREFLSETPLIAPRRTVIVDNAAAMTTEAENALLKTAEEPPRSSLLILILRDPESIAPTLASRFQKIYLGPVAEKEIASWLQSRGVPNAEAVAKASRGLPGLAEKIASGAAAKEEASAREFLAIPPASRRDFLKELLEPEDFSFKRFLESLINVLSRDKKRNSALWHAVLELRGIADATGLSPRIQLINLWTLI
jgi:DNA polymerase-3 subunit delta'